MFDALQLEIMEKLQEKRGDPPKVIPKPPSELIPSDHVRCACNKKNIHISEVKYHRTGVVAASDSICRECLAMVPKHALVVCVKCQAVVARVAPCRDASGFEFKARHFYHTDSCPGCKPDLQASILIEKVLFDRQKNL